MVPLTSSKHLEVGVTLQTTTISLLKREKSPLDDESGLEVAEVRVELDPDAFSTGERKGDLEIRYTSSRTELQDRPLSSTTLPLIFEVDKNDQITRCWGKKDHSCYTANIDPNQGNTLVGCGGTSDVTSSTEAGGAVRELQRHTASLGFKAGASSLGERNVFVGYKAGEKHLLGNNNIFIGSHAGRDLAWDAKNQLAIGNQHHTTWFSGTIGKDVLTVGGQEVATDADLQEVSEAIRLYRDAIASHRHGNHRHSDTMSEEDLRQEEDNREGTERASEIETYGKTQPDPICQPGDPCFTVVNCPHTLTDINSWQNQDEWSYSVVCQEGEVETEWQTFNVNQGGVCKDLQYGRQRCMCPDAGIDEQQIKADFQATGWTYPAETACYYPTPVLNTLDRTYWVLSNDQSTCIQLRKTGSQCTDDTISCTNPSVIDSWQHSYGWFPGSGTGYCDNHGGRVVVQSRIFTEQDDNVTCVDVTKNRWSCRCPPNGYSTWLSGWLSGSPGGAQCTSAWERRDTESDDFVYLSSNKKQCVERTEHKWKCECSRGPGSQAGALANIGSSYTNTSCPSTHVAISDTEHWYRQTSGLASCLQHTVVRYQCNPCTPTQSQAASSLSSAGYTQTSGGGCAHGSTSSSESYRVANSTQTSCVTSTLTRYKCNPAPLQQHTHLGSCNCAGEYSGCGHSGCTTYSLRIM